LQRIGFLWPPFPCPLGDWDPRHSFDNPGPSNLISLAHPLVVLPSLRSLTGGGRQDSRTRPDTSPGVCSPSAHAGSRQLVLLELPTFSLLACEVSHRCTPYTPSRSDPALFHAGGALGVAPFRALIIQKVRTSLEVGYPLVGPLSFRLLPLVEPVPFQASMSLRSRAEVGGVLGSLQAFRPGMDDRHHGLREVTMPVRKQRAEARRDSSLH